MELTRTQQALFTLLRHAIGKPHDPLPEDVDWDEVLREAMEQMVPILAAGALRELSTDPAVQTRASETELAAMQRNMLAAHALSETDRLMRENGCPYVILKGYAAAGWYPEPMRRMLGDVDFLVGPEHLNTAVSVLLAEGYQKEKKERPHHLKFTKPNQELELHFNIPGVPEGQAGEAVARYMRGVILEPEEKPLVLNRRGKVIPVPQHKYHGLILLLHMQRHMQRGGLGVRQLMDLAVFVDGTARDEFWEKELLPLLRKIGLYRYAQVMVKTGAILFGTACPEWALAAEEELCMAVMSDLMNAGNFGRKNRERAYSWSMIDISRKGNDSRLRKAYRFLHEGTPKIWPGVREHKVLWFFADWLRVLRRICLVIIGKKPSLIRASTYVEERKSVYDRLRIFEQDET